MPGQDGRGHTRRLHGRIDRLRITPLEPAGAAQWRVMSSFVNVGLHPGKESRYSVPGFGSGCRTLDWSVSGSSAERFRVFLPGARRSQDLLQVDQRRHPAAHRVRFLVAADAGDPPLNRLPLRVVHLGFRLFLMRFPLRNQAGARRVSRCRHADSRG